ncbi:unnamed protein product, partial [Ceratitis capitata]
PKPIPMDTDHSQQTRAVNYINRPNFNAIAGNDHHRHPTNKAATTRTNSNESTILPKILTKDYEEDTTQYEEMQPWEEYNNEYKKQFE